MVMVVACGGNNASSKESSSSSNVSTSTSTPTSTISTSSSRNPYDDFETPVENSFSYESLAVTDERDFFSLAGETWKFHWGAVSGAE